MKVSTASDQRRIGRATVEVRKRQRRRLRPTLLALEDRRLLSTFTVTSTLDDGSAWTLRYEIGLANSTGDPSEPCLEPATVRWLDEVAPRAEKGDVAYLKSLGEVFRAVATRTKCFP